MGTKDFNLLDLFIAKLRLSKVIKHIAPNTTVLDFGCGYQYILLKSIKKTIKNGYGIDYDIKNSTEENISLIRRIDVDTLPFNDKSIDHITLLAVLEHIELDKVTELFIEFNRILKPHGTIILTTPTPKSKRFLEFLAYNLKIISEAEIRDHKKYYNKEDVRMLAENSGLQIMYYSNFQFGLNSLSILKKTLENL